MTLAIVWLSGTPEQYASDVARHADKPWVGRVVPDAQSLIRQTVVMARPEGFEWSSRKSGEVVILHHGRVAATLRGRSAVEFVADVVHGDDQELMARITGNYKHGNERIARDHPRNRDRQ